MICGTVLRVQQYYVAGVHKDRNHRLPFAVGNAVGCPLLFSSLCNGQGGPCWDSRKLNRCRRVLYREPACLLAKSPWEGGRDEGGEGEEKRKG